MDSEATEDSQTEIVAEGPNSTVYRSVSGDSVTAIKCSSYRKEYSQEPHDIIKELKVLQDADHPNIISFLGYNFEEQSSSTQFWMPYIPYSLPGLLDCPTFNPYSGHFEPLAKSIIYQIAHGIAYLHGLSSPIAHRDIKPANVLLTPTGCVKLIDFGQAYVGDIPQKFGDLDFLWPEKPERMYFEVATGPYRAPELLLGTRQYVAPAIDLWSLGCTIAEFFTPIQTPGDCDEGGFEEDEDEEEPKMRRGSLFSGNRGEIGLLWSIFKIRGTPTEETWPGFSSLTGSTSFSFNIVPAVELATLLPNLPSPPSLPLDLINKLLSYPPKQRLSASQTLQHPWLSPSPSLPYELTNDQEQATKLATLLKEFLR